MHLHLLTCLFVLLAGPTLAASDGTILERQPVDLDAVLAAAPAPVYQEIIETLRERVDIARISYLSDGLEVTGYLALPREPDRVPGLIYCRGGNRQFGALNDLDAAAILGPLAALGYAVVGPQYRGNEGGEGQEEFGGADLADVLNCIPLLESLERVEADRLAIYGWSRGGLMAYQALAATERFGAAVIGAGLSDCVDLLERRPKLGPAVFAEVIPEWSTDREGALLRRSPVRWADRLCATTPILMMHSNADQRVHPSQALHMAEALLAAGVPHRLVMFEDGDHLLGRHRDEVLALSAAWLDRWLDGDGAE